MSTLPEWLDAEFAEILYKDICFEEIEAVAGSDLRAVSFSHGVRLSEDAVTTWQEVAALTSSLLVLWFSREPEPGEDDVLPTTTLQTHVRTIPLTSVREVNVEKAYSADSTLLGVRLLVILSTPDVVDSSSEHAHTHVYMDTLRFTKGPDDGPEKVALLASFARELSRLVAHQG